MKIMLALLLAGLLATLSGCGYTAKASTPPTMGTVPAIVTLNPDEATAGSAVMLTINGSNFSGTATVNWNGTAQTGTAWVSSNQLTVMIPATVNANPGTVSVNVTNPGIAGGPYGGGTSSETSNSETFTVN
jgi:hypothetical protein